MRGPPSLHRQRLAGVVTLARAGQFVYVQTKERGFRVNTPGCGLIGCSGSTLQVVGNNIVLNLNAPAPNAPGSLTDTGTNVGR